MIAILATLALLLGGRTAELPKSALIIIMDDVGLKDFEKVSDLGGTPTMDALAAQGIYFTAAYANATCSVTRRSLFFGKYNAHDTGPQCPADPIPGDLPQTSETSIAELLAPEANTAVLGKWHLGESPSGGNFLCAPLEHGFDYWLAGTVPGVCGVSGYTTWTRVDHCASTLSTTYEPQVLTGTFVPGWTSQNGTERLCVVAMQLPHAPFHSPPQSYLPPGWPSPGLIAPDLSKYRAMIAACDVSVKKMLGFGDVPPIVNLATTLVIIVGDNGPPGQIQPEKGKGTTFERGIHVPMIILGGPVVAGGRTCPELVHVVDIYATIGEWMGSGVPAGDGVSLLPIIKNETHAPPHASIVCGSNIDNDVCVRTDHLKLRRTDSGPEELYDLTTDPQELTSVLGDPAYATDQAILQAELDAFLAR